MLSSRSRPEALRTIGIPRPPISASTWPDEPRPTGVQYPGATKLPRFGEAPSLSGVLGDVGIEIRSLKPASMLQQNLARACDEQYRDMLTARWKAIESERASISYPFYWVLVFWLAILFGSFGLTTRPNATIMALMALCALSITVAVFVILDLDQPYGGLFGISSATMREALADLMR